MIARKPLGVRIGEGLAALVALSTGLIIVAWLLGVAWRAFRLGAGW